MIDIETVMLIAGLPLAISLLALVRSARRPDHQPIVIPVPKMEPDSEPVQVELDPVLLMRIRLSEVRLRRARLEKAKREELDSLEDSRLLVDLLLHKATPEDAETERHLAQMKGQARDRIEQLRNDMLGLARLDETLSAQCDELTDPHDPVPEDRLRDRAAFVIWVDKGLEEQLREARDALTEAVKRRERIQKLVIQVTGNSEIELRHTEGKPLHSSLMH